MATTSKRNVKTPAMKLDDIAADATKQPVDMIRVLAYRFHPVTLFCFYSIYGPDSIVRSTPLTFSRGQKNEKSS